MVSSQCTNLITVQDPRVTCVGAKFYALAGLHPDGIPCQGKDSVKFESITRDVRRDPHSYEISAQLGEHFVFGFLTAYAPI